MGKGRGDDSSSSSDETDGKVKCLYMIICILAVAVAIFGIAVFVLVVAGQASGATSEIGAIKPPAGTYSTPQILTVEHDDYEPGTDDVFIYCTDGKGLQHAEVPCESSKSRYDPSDKFNMDTNGAYACIFCKENELCSIIVENNYIVNAQPPKIVPENGPTATSATTKTKISFSIPPYSWKFLDSSAQTYVFYTNKSKPSMGDFVADQIVDGDFESCPGAPAVPCWPPVVKASRAQNIFKYDQDHPPYMDASVKIAAVTKRKDMGMSPVALLAYTVSSVSEVRVEPCMQDAQDFTTETQDILMWTSTPGAKIQYTVHHASACINAYPGVSGVNNVGAGQTVVEGVGHRSGATNELCVRDLTNNNGNVDVVTATGLVDALPANNYPNNGNPVLSSHSISYGDTNILQLGTKYVADDDATTVCMNIGGNGVGERGDGTTAKHPSEPCTEISERENNLHPASPCKHGSSGASCMFVYSQPFKIQRTARVMAVGTHPNDDGITDSILTLCDYEIRVATPTCTTTTGSAWMFPSGDAGALLGSPSTGTGQSQNVNTNSATLRYLAPTPQSAVSFTYCDFNDNCDGSSNTYDPAFPPLIYQSVKIKAEASKSELTKSGEIICTYYVKYSPPVFTPLPGADNYFPEAQVVTVAPWTQCRDVDFPNRGCKNAIAGSQGGAENDMVISYRMNDPPGVTNGDGSVATGVDCCSLPIDVETYDNNYKVRTGNKDCPWMEYTGDLTLGRSERICIKAEPNTNTESLRSDVKTNDFFIYCQPPIYNTASYTVAINTINVCAHSITVNSKVHRRTDLNTLSMGFTDQTSAMPLATFTSQYPFGTVPAAGLTAATATQAAPVCFDMTESRMVSAVTIKDKLAPSTGPTPSSIGAPTRSFYFIEVDLPAITPDQLAVTGTCTATTCTGADTSVCTGADATNTWVAAGAANGQGYCKRSSVASTGALVLPDVDQNGRGDLYTQTEVTIETNANYAATTVKYAIETYHCEGMDVCSSTARTTIDGLAAAFTYDTKGTAADLTDDTGCNMYDPEHSCSSCTAPLSSIFTADAFTTVFSDSCLDYLNVRHPKVAQYVITCNGWSNSDHAAELGKIAPLSGCNFETYDSTTKPVVDRSSFVYSYAERADCEKSQIAMQEYEIIVAGVAIKSTTDCPGGVLANCANGEATLVECPSALATPSGYYVGPTAVKFSTTTPDGRLIGAEVADVTIKYFWSQVQFDSGTINPSNNVQCGSTPPCADSANCAPRCAQDNSVFTSRYEYTFQGTASGGLTTDGRPVIATDTGRVHGVSYNPQVVAATGTAAVDGLLSFESVSWTPGTDFTAVEIGTVYAYAEKPGLTNSHVSSCEMELQAMAPGWFQSGEICNEVSNSDTAEPVCKSPALFGSGFVFLWSESATVINYELSENEIASLTTRTSTTFDRWIQLVATDTTFFYSLKTFSIKRGMWDSDEVNQPFVVVTEISRGAIPSTDLPEGLESDVCQGCEVENILFGRPGQFWGAEWDALIVGGKVSITMDFPGRWDEAFVECSDTGGGTKLTAENVDANYLVTTVYFAYPFIPDPARNYQRAASACRDYEVMVQQKEARGLAAATGNRQWYLGGEEFDSAGLETKCKGTAASRTDGCWRETVSAGDDRQYRSSDSYTPQQPIRATALKYTCNLLPFYVESWVVYGIPGASLDTANIAASGTGASCNGGEMADCNGVCQSEIVLGDGTCDCKNCNDALIASGKSCTFGSNPDANCIADFNCVDFLYDRMDCFELESSDTGGQSIKDIFTNGYGSG